jgi:hypothetical protein
MFDPVFPGLMMQVINVLTQCALISARKCEVFTLHARGGKLLGKTARELRLANAVGPLKHVESSGSGHD